MASRALLVALSVLSLGSTMTTALPSVDKRQVGVTNGACETNPNVCIVAGELWGCPQSHPCCQLIAGEGIDAIQCS
ncbi:hypothetical protein CLCR_11385 [Cladophialophora carrionii]|uniref:Uncharacterized protein n=1 Tax=Cladophialophora carrionii TaxID=86049 RepID=A0A1C1CTE6_9EURO|nr:hypothetical protein CLCR_11385 [Cladophialophora carrionii]